jgi:HSP20 family protein
MNVVPWRNKTEDRIETAFDSALSRFRHEMDSFFDRFFGGGWGPPALESLPARFGYGPRIDLAETDTEVTIKAELPGIDPKEVDLRVEGNTLTLRGEKRQEREEKRRDYRYVERQYGSFQRSIQLPGSVDPEKVDASYKDGILTVIIAKRPEARAKRITVRNA